MPRAPRPPARGPPPANCERARARARPAAHALRGVAPAGGGQAAEGLPPAFRRASRRRDPASARSARAARPRSARRGGARRLPPRVGTRL